MRYQVKARDHKGDQVRHKRNDNPVNRPVNRDRKKDRYVDGQRDQDHYRETS